MSTRIAVRTCSNFTADESGRTLIITLQQDCLNSRLSDRDRLQLGFLLTRYRQVVLDLAMVSTANGSGVYRIADWIDFIRSDGNAVVLARCCATVRVLFALLRISRLIPVAATLQDALDFFESGHKALAHPAG
jgi:ABC-type transporter Mla MlaB component